MPPLEPLWGASAALVLLASGAATARILAGRLLPGEEPGVVWCAAGALWLWLCLALFQVLAPLGLFTLPAALAAWSALALAARLFLDPGGARLGAGLAELLDGARRLARLLTGRNAWLALPLATLLAATSARAALTPPLTWDSLTYHLFKAGQWVQHGGLFELEAPDAWSYYRFFPANGDVLSAWFLLPFHGDLVVNLTSLLPWALAVGSLRALVRRLGAGAGVATLGAAVYGFTPAVFFVVRTSLVEVQLAAELLCGTLFLVRFLERRRAGDAAVMAAAFGAALGTKLIAVPVVGVAVALCVAWTAVVRAPRRGPLLAPLGLVALGALVSARWYAEAWLQHGSPVYPFPLTVLGERLAAGNRSLQALLDRGNQGFVGVPLRETLPRYADLVNWNYTTLAPLAPLVVLLAPLGAVALWRRGRRAAVAVLLTLAAAVVHGFLSPEVRGCCLQWMIVMTRFLLYPLGALAALAIPLAEGRGLCARALRAALVLAVPFELVRCLPREWAELGAEDPARFALRAAAALAALAGAAWSARFLLDRPIRPRVALVAGLLALALSPWLARGLAVLRAERRYAAFATLRDQPALGWWYAVDLWRLCDRPGTPLRIAFAAGFRAEGHNWYWYPLLGTWLQNTVAYVPVTADGSIIDYELQPEVVAAADFHAWLRRIVEGRFDLVVSMPGPTQEVLWMRAHPEVFHSEWRPSGRWEEELVRGGLELFRVDRSAGESLLESSG